MSRVLTDSPGSRACSCATRSSASSRRARASTRTAPGVSQTPAHSTPTTTTTITQNSSAAVTTTPPTPPPTARHAHLLQQFLRARRLRHRCQLRLRPRTLPLGAADSLALPGASVQPASRSTGRGRATMPVLRRRRMMTTMMLTPSPPMTVNSDHSRSSNTHQNQQSSPRPLPLLLLLTTLCPRAATSEREWEQQGERQGERQQQQARARVRVAQGVGSAIVRVRHPPDLWSLFSLFHPRRLTFNGVTGRRRRRQSALLLEWKVVRGIQPLGMESKSGILFSS
jgi:hypothetical protein